MRSSAVVAPTGGGKLGALARRRLRAGRLSVPSEHPERVRGDRVRNATRLKAMIGRFYDESRAALVHREVDAVEPPTRAERGEPPARVPPGRLLLGDDDDLGDD